MCSNMDNRTVVRSYNNTFELSRVASLFIIIGSLICLLIFILGLIIYIEKRQNTKRLTKRKKVYPNEII
jgi:flagellar biogenesis protein FliO